MRRLIYSPYVQAFINTDEGVIDVSPYIVSGSVNRKINQVSSAQLTLRNPIGRGTGKLLFTQYARKSDHTEGPLFHPQDAIIIVMQRLQNHPVQVFTGYLDKTPYIQLYPGLCTLEASCTLKSLLYTQWDSALPFVRYFLELYGWVPNGDSGLVNPNAEAQRLQTEAGTAAKLQGRFNDGSIGALLFAVMNEIGAWNEKNIYIEALPVQIKDMITTLYTQTSKEAQQGNEKFQSLISDILGASSQGSGSSTNPLNLVGGPAWEVPASAEDDPPGASASCGPLPADRRGYSVLSLSGRASDAATAGQALSAGSVWPCSTDLIITNPANGKSATVHHVDNGAGSDAILPVVGIYPATRDDLGLSGGSMTVIIQRADGKDLTPVRGKSVTTPTPASTSQPPATQQPSSTNAGGSPAHTGAHTSSVAPTHAAFSPSVQTNVKARAAAPARSSSSGGSSSSGASTSTQTQLTRFEVMVQAANTITAQNFPYAWGGGHGKPGVPNPDIRTGGAPGFDCSGAVTAVLFAAGLTTTSFSTFDEVGTLRPVIDSGIDTAADAVNIFVKTTDHTFMQIGGRYFGTSGQVPTDPNGGPGWFQGSLSAGYLAGFQAYHIKRNLLTQQTANALPAAAGGPGGSASVPGGTSSGGGGSSTNATAAAFSTFINLPSIFASAEALAFSGKRSFMADQPLFPFIEQLCQAAMRSFMSMPNGNFFAFFPDYFGFFGRKYYWEIADIEIIDARIDLTDDPLVTHVAVAGDVTQYHGQVDVFDMVQTAGIFDIFDAFTTGYVHNSGSLIDPQPTRKTPSAKSVADSKTKALDFLQKYGARPLLEQLPMVRSPFFELFLAFQKFMVMWSRQFQTAFELTFMPELFPGGLVALPDHHLQVYIEEVIHTFDYTEGFTTTVNVSSPSILDSESNPNISRGMAR